jgi:type I restriction enzyme S subunit
LPSSLKSSGFWINLLHLPLSLPLSLQLLKKQYNYYRDQLLSFGEGEVEWKQGRLQHILNHALALINLIKNYVGVDNLLQNRTGKMQSNYVPTSGNLTEFREGDILIGTSTIFEENLAKADSTGRTTDIGYSQLP